MAHKITVGVLHTTHAMELNFDEIQCPYALWR